MDDVLYDQRTVGKHNYYKITTVDPCKNLSRAKTFTRDLDDKPPQIRPYCLLIYLRTSC